MNDFIRSLEKCPHCGSAADKFCTNVADGLGRMPFGIVCDGCPATVTLYTFSNKFPDDVDWAKARDYWNRRKG